MKALCITFEAPSRKYGGGIGILQSLASVASAAEIDYAGPAFDPAEFPEITIRNRYFLRENGNVAAKCLHLLRGVCVKYYGAWRKLAERLDPSGYDFVFVDFSYNDFLVRWAHRHGQQALVRVHNIERDMVDGILKTKRCDRYRVKAVLSGPMIRRREAACVRAADGLVFLTREDFQRALLLYPDAGLSHKSCVVPVCLPVPAEGRENVPVPGPYVLLTGSLYYGANAAGVEWFLLNVWPLVCGRPGFSDLRLVVAGGKPGQAMRGLCAKASRCALVADPEDMGPYFDRAALYAAPVFSGAGMKVKVAEALSHGLFVVGTSHALIGYEHAARFLRRADTPEAFAEQLCACLAEHGGNREKERCRAAFAEHYAVACSQKAFQRAVYRMLRSGPYMPVKKP